MRSSGARKRELDPVTRYALDVVEDRIIACRLVRLACERHLRDLDTGWQRGLRWNPAAAQRIIDYYRFLRHTKGEWAGRVVTLSPWQQFRLGSVFGWQRQDQETGKWLRRFRKAYNEVARKNGKSTEAAGLAAYMLDADGEPGAEIYSAATKHDQAKIVWGEAAKMVRRSPALRDRIQIYGNPLKPGPANMSVEETGSKFEPLGADGNTLDGLNIHCGIVDEFQAHKNRDVWDAFETGIGARRQPLLWAITTAGYDRTGICYELRSYSVEVLEGRIEDDSWFAYIATLDPEDLEGMNWLNEEVWIKPNPNLGVSVKLDELRDLAKKARETPASLNAFLTKRLNVWTQQFTVWIPLEVWDANTGEIIVEEKLLGRTCFGGLDLSSVSDITAWVLVFPHEDDPEAIDILPRFWVPEKRLYAADNRYRDQYQAWARAGLLKTTPGDAVDYDFVIKRVLEDARKFRLVDLNIDRLFQAHQVAVKLMDELGEDRVIGMGQGFMSMSAPSKEWERRVLRGKLHHGGHPILRWMAGNVAVKRDPADNIKPDKAESQGKIDGIVAGIMALDRAMRHLGPARSIYEDGAATVWY